MIVRARKLRESPRRARRSEELRQLCGIWTIGFGMAFRLRTGWTGDSSCLTFASEGDIKALASVGHEIGSHTFSHVSVGSLSRRALAIETMRSIEVLQSMTGRSAVDHFAYPYGEITLSAKRWLARSFVTMRSIFPGVNVGRIDFSALRAVPLYQRAIDEEQIDRWICRNLSSAGWLIFYTHDVSETPSPYGVSTALFEAAVSKAVASGARVLNVEQACRVIRGSSSGLGGRALRE